MRFACVRIAHLPTRLETSLQPELSNQPLVVLRAWDEHVLDASPDMEASGVRPGDSRRRVEQLCPQAVVLPARETLYQSHHESLKSVLVNFADRVEASALGEFYIEIGALSRIFPSEQALAEQIVAQAHQTMHLTPAVGIAASKFTALQAAASLPLKQIMSRRCRTCQCGTRSGWCIIPLKPCETKNGVSQESLTPRYSDQARSI